MSSATNFVSSFGYNFGGQLIARLCSFGVNILLLRVVSTEILGIANVRLTLLYTTVLFLVREPFRKACVRPESGERDSGSETTRFLTTSLVNLLWFCPCVCFILGSALSIIWVFILARPPVQTTPNYVCAVFIFFLSAQIESLAEPLWILCQQFRRVKAVAAIQSVHILLQRLIVGFIIVVFPGCDLMAFSLGMLLSSTAYTGLFYVYMWKLCRNADRPLVEGRKQLSLRDLFPRRAIPFDRERWVLARSFFRHSCIKQFLTDGSQYVMTFFNVLTFAEQGVYDAIEKLGSLFARIVLAPLEESAYVYFSQNIQRGKTAEQQDKTHFAATTQMLRTLLKGTSLLGLIVSVFGYSYAYLALSLYGGRALSQGTGPSILRTYSVYVFLMALNGITECFTFAAMHKSELEEHERFLSVVTALYVAAQILLASLLGGIGFVLANSLNMILRVAYSLRFMGRFYSSNGGDRPWRALLPNAYTAAALAGAWGFTWLSARLFCCDGAFNSAAHAAVGALALTAVVLVAFTTDFTLSQLIDRLLMHAKAA